ASHQTPLWFRPSLPVDQENKSATRILASAASTRNGATERRGHVRDYDAVETVTVEISFRGSACDGRDTAQKTAAAKSATATVTSNTAGRLRERCCGAISCDVSTNNCSRARR